jgi:hypothetical protein
MTHRAGWVVVALGAAVLATSTSCGGRGDCGDGSDNDRDGLIDADDPGCEFNGDQEAPDPDFAACGDGVDNDSDGAIDLADPGCDSASDEDEYNEPVAGCKDGIDNDGDDLLDFPNDPGCQVSLDDDESDDCPDGSGCPVCANGSDDDGDQAPDYPDDLGCDSASDTDEFNADPSICGPSVPLQPLPPDGLVNGFLDADGTSALISLECGGSGTEHVYQITVEQPIALVARTDFPETEIDTVLYLRRECRESSSELACDDDVGEATGSRIRAAELEPGTYYLVVDARSNGLAGAFKLEVERYLAAGAACDPDDPSLSCPPGLLCRLLEPDAAGETCARPACSDRRDFDGDGLDDYPDDPGCESRDDNDESDSCPDGASCPECADGVDNGDSEDSRADYPADLGCSSAADDSETNCSDSDPLRVISKPTTTGDTSNASNDSAPTCGVAGDAPDIAHQLAVPGHLVSLTVDTDNSDFDTTLYIKRGDCDAGNLTCDDDSGDPGNQSAFTMNDVDAGLYFIIVDGYSGNSGAYKLHVHGVIANGQPCNATQVDSGLWSCAGGGTCTGGRCQN